MKLKLTDIEEFRGGAFNEQSYKDNDKLAKDLFIPYIESKGHIIINSEENYQHDVTTEKNGNKYFFELEMKINYPFTSKKTFPYDTVSFLGRKERLHEINPFNYVIICKETYWAACCDSRKIFLPEYYQSITARAGRNGQDRVYRIPKEDCNFINLLKIK